MKNVKKLLSILMVLTLVLSLGASAFAATITVTGHQDVGSVYSAYKLMNVTQNDDLFLYTLNPKYVDVVDAGLGAIEDAPHVQKDAEGKVTNETAIIDYMSKLAKDGEAIRDFAQAAFEKLGDNTTPEGTYTVTGAADETVAIEVDDQGYYLIAEKVNTGADGDAVTSLVMLDTAGNENAVVKTKEDVPTSKKEVADINDSKDTAKGDWQDSADYDIGDDVPFQLTGTLPKDFVAYDSYKLVFHDVESKGLTFNPESVVVKVDGVEIETGYVVKYPADDNCTFDIIFRNVKSISEAGNGSVITVEYTSKLNTDAEVGFEGNPNTMHMEFTNNHHGEGTGNTPDNTVIVFTFIVEVDKVDGADKALGGAGFTLLKKLASGGEEITIGEQTYKDVKKIADNVQVVGLKEDGSVAGPQETDLIVKYSVDFKGLDDGDYILVESTVPENYNKAADVEFTITAEHQAEAVHPELTELAADPLTVEKTTEGKITGHLNAKVVNLTGLELPETGGIGTTIFYVAGAVLVAAAVILLVTRKRMSGADK